MISPYRRQIRKHICGGRGFALIASLTLLMLLGMIAMGILSVVMSQNRVATQVALAAEARQQALMGLDAAIAELQVQLGPDQRVSASSGILSENSRDPQHILGVWDSWSAPIYGSINGRRISSTYGAGRRSMFRKWLISSRDSRNLRNMDSVRDLCSRRPGQRVALVGEGTMGHGADSSSYIYADLITMPANGNNEGCFAWWVCGENQKANLAVKAPEKTEDLIEVLHRTWDTPPPDFTGSSKLSFLANGEEIPAPEKVITLKTLALVSHSSKASGEPYFFDVTPYSYSLATNVRDGGLKYDLNLLLNKKTLDKTPYAARTGMDCPIAEGEGVPIGLEPNMPIGSWQVMHGYHNTWPDGSGNDSSGFSARLIGPVSKAYSSMSGHLRTATTSRGDQVTFYEDRVIAGDAQAGYSRSPLLLSFMGAWGLMLTEPQKGGFGGYSHMLAYAPFTMWWNPYNVRMRVGAKKLWLMSLPYRLTSVFVKTDGVKRRWPMVQALRKSVDGNGNIGQRNTFGDDWGNYLVNSESDQSNDIIFEPGEILVFSMAKGVNSVALHNQNGEGSDDQTPPNIQPQQVPFIIGDNAGELHNYALSFYSYGERWSIANSLMLETKSVYDASNVVTTIDSGDGAYSNGTYLFDTAGDVFGPREREAFVVPHGFNGIDASSQRGKSMALSRESSKADRFPGAGGIAPNNFSLGWYDYEKSTEAEVTFVQDQYWNANMTMNDPTYYMAVGVAPKSFNDSFNEGIPMFRGKDYRTKVWLHSNPALGSSALYKPDDQERQYNPFQLATVEMGVGLSRGVLDTPNNRNGVWGLSSAGAGGGESVSFIATHELPMHPPMSLAAFAGMRLKPGWYETPEDSLSLANMRRMQYQAGVPGVGIGNSFADPCLPADDVHAVHETRIVSAGLSMNGRIFSDFFDYGLIINDALWDRWFCSSLADVPTLQGKREVSEIATRFVHGEESLPVSRYKLAPSAGNEKEVLRRILADDGWMHVARYLLVEGGFNVNSTSEEAWAAMLQSLSRRDLVSNAGGNLSRVSTDGRGVLFSRFMVPTSNESIDRVSYNVLQGSGAVRPGLRLATAWGDLRQLSSDSIRELAREIVKKVRERGPFLSMSDFINRRLDGGSDTALMGALQAAIEATDINDMFKANSYNVKVVTEGSLYRYPKAEEGSMFTAAPGYLIQSDVLASLGNILTVRDDTFIVRAYGCVRNARRAVLAQAWCEAVVQRTMEYVDPTNTADTAPTSNTRRDTSGNTGLTEINRVMGRRFRVVSFRWLDAWDI